MERTVDATIARRQLGTLLDEVYYKVECIIIERKGKPLAKIVPLNSSEHAKESSVTSVQRKLLAELNSLPTLKMEKEPTEVLRKIRKKRASREKERYWI